MKIFDAAQSFRASPTKAWGLAVGSFAVALAVRFATDDVLPAGFPYLTFFPAVILTAFFAGTLPGIACAIASGLSAWYWFIPPAGGFETSPAVIVALVFYICIVAVDILLIEGMRRSMEKLAEERQVTLELAARQKTLLDDARDRERRKRVLQQELIHRMKNTFAMVQAVVSQSLRHSNSLEEAVEVTSTRIQALGRAQDILTDTNWQATDIREVVDASLLPHIHDPQRWSISGPAAPMNAMQSMGLALLLHEMATNAAKYGALKTSGGRVELAWSIDGNAFCLDWTERGGPPVGPPVRKGFGSRLIERVVPGYFGGTARLDHLAEGVCLTLKGVLDGPERRSAEAQPQT